MSHRLAAAQAPLGAVAWHTAPPLPCAAAPQVLSHPLYNLQANDAGFRARVEIMHRDVHGRVMTPPDPRFTMCPGALQVRRRAPVRIATPCQAHLHRPRSARCFAASQQPATATADAFSAAAASDAGPRPNVLQAAAAPLVAAWLRHAASGLESASPADQTRLLQIAALFAAPPATDWLQRFYAASLGRVRGYSGRQAVALLAALGSLRLQPPPAWLEAFYLQAALVAADGASGGAAREALDALPAFAAFAHHRPAPEAAAALCDAAGSALASASPRQLAAAGDALLVLDYRPPATWITTYCDAFRAKAPSLGPSELLDALATLCQWADGAGGAAAAALCQSPAFEAAVLAAQQRLQYLAASEIAAALGLLGRAGVPADPAAVAPAAQRLQAALPALPPAALSDLLAALVRVGYTPSSSFMEAALEVRSVHEGIHYCISSIVPINVMRTAGLVNATWCSPSNELRCCRRPKPLGA